MYIKQSRFFVDSEIYSLLLTSIMIIEKIFNYELLGISSRINNYFQFKLINNGLCNCTLWMVIIWGIVYKIFDFYLQHYLKKTGFKYYICQRLTKSFWSILTYILLIIYFLEILIINNNTGNNELLFTTKWKTQTLQNTTRHQPNYHLIFALISLCAFYLNSIFLRIIKLNSSFIASTNGVTSCLLFLITVWAFAIEHVEIPLILTILIGIPEILTELTRIYFSSIICNRHNHNNISSNNCLVKLFQPLFILSQIVWLIIYIIVIPVRFLLPLQRHLCYNFTLSQSLMFILLLFWFIVAIYQSVIISFKNFKITGCFIKYWQPLRGEFRNVQNGIMRKKEVLLKLFSHWLYHNNQNAATNNNENSDNNDDTTENDNDNLSTTNSNYYDLCYSKNKFECALFPEQRSDASYFLSLLRTEMKIRENERIAKRKPKNRGVVFQTLKCMLAIKKKRKNLQQQSSVTSSNNNNNGDSDNNELDSDSDNATADNNSDHGINQSKNEEASDCESKIVIRIRKESEDDKVKEMAKELSND